MPRLGLQVHTAGASQKRRPCNALATIASGVAEVPLRDARASKHSGPGGPPTARQTCRSALSRACPTSG